jgi:hypothetical protein
MPIFAQQVKLDFNKNKEPDERVSPLYKEETEQYAIEIREIVIREKLAMEAEISKVDDDLKNGNISDSLAGNLKADIALRFSERIDSGIGNLKFDLDEAVKKQVQYSIMNTDVEKLKEEQAEEEWHYKPQNELGGYLSYGMISLPDDDNAALNDHLSYSSGIDFGFLYHRQFSETSPFVLMTGAYLSWRTIRFDDDYLISRNDEGNVDLYPYAKKLDKSKLRATYIMVPVGIKYSFNSLKTKNDESYRDPDDGIAVTANLYGGFRISSNNIVDGEDVDYRDKKTNYKLNDFAYGAQFTLSIDDWNFFVRQELSPYFKDGTFDDRRMLQFGVNLGF